MQGYNALDSPVQSQPWYNYPLDSPTQPPSHSKPASGPSKLIAALDAADIIEISSSDEDENVIDLTGLDDIPQKRRAIAAKSMGNLKGKGKASTVPSDKPWVVLV